MEAFGYDFITGAISANILYINGTWHQEEAGQPAASMSCCWHAGNQLQCQVSKGVFGTHLALP